MFKYHFYIFWWVNCLFLFLIFYPIFGLFPFISKMLKVTLGTLALHL